MNTGSNAARRPFHRWRGLTVSPVIARRPHADATLLPRAQVPVEPFRPQTPSRTNATKRETTRDWSSLPSRTALARWRNCPSMYPSSAGGTNRDSLLKPGSVEQQPAMAQPFPTRHDGIRLPPGRLLRGNSRSRHIHNAMSTISGVVDVSSSKLTQSLSKR